MISWPRAPRHFPPLLALLLVLSPAVAAEDGPRIVADELDQLDIARPIEGRIVARYGSRVGKRLEVEGSGVPLVLAPGAESAALDDAKITRGLMELVVEPTDGKSLRVLEVHPCPNALSAFRSASAQERDSVARERALLVWGFRESARGDSALLEDVTRRWTRLGAGQLEETANGAIRWLKLAATTIGDSPHWVRFANSVAERFEGDATVIAALESLDLIQTETDWRPRSRFFEEVGLVEEKGTVVTVDRAALREAIAEWKATGRQATLLRGRTSAQYERLVAAHEVTEGMERDEVVQAWGYPRGVTWERRGRTVFEAWTYADRRVFLIHGWVFAVR